MSVKQVSFEAVFSGGANLGPEVIVGQPLETVLREFGFHAEDGEDGLDRFQAVPLEVSVPGAGPVRFALWRHAGNPPGTFAIHMAVGTGNSRPISQILEELHISHDRIMWRAEQTQPV